jgi:beta-glucuronidase
MNQVDDASADVRTISDPLGENAGCSQHQRILRLVLGARGRCRQDAVEIEVEQAADRQANSAAGRPTGDTAMPMKSGPTEYQQSLYQQQLGMIERMPNLAGLSPWGLMHFRSPARLLPGVQDDHNRKGLISSRGQRKMAFSTLQNFYKKLAEAGKRRGPTREILASA